MAHYYAGIDLGTTATKAVVFNQKGDVLYQVSREYPMYHPQPECSTQHPQDLLTATKECIEDILARFEVRFISFSAAMQSLILVDEHHQAMTDCMIWADNRAADIADTLKQSITGQRFYDISGIPIHSFSPMTKIAWLKEHEPSLLASAHKLISAKEYIWYHLTHEYTIDTTLASGTGLMDIHSLQWSEEILNYLSIQKTQLSIIVKSTHRAYCKQYGLELVSGGGDGILANLGSGAITPDKMALTIGTSGAVRVVSSQPFIDPQMRTQCYHLFDTEYLKLGAVNNGAVVLQWLKNNILETVETYQELFEKAEQVPVGSEGLLFVPYILGERAPIWDAKAKGIMIGLDMQHTQGHIIRASMEGILFGLKQIAEVLVPQKETLSNMTLMVSGGFAKSNFWLQMTADIFQMKVEVSNTIESSAWGAVLLGFQSFGIEYKNEIKNEIVFYPNKGNSRVYQQGFERFKNVYTQFLKV
ncbi:gluconokinase [Flectobacillus sp. BAB-3569]|uniref:gluconokinase n=1 Tax=Flectobacillus sp. BAB-3569 TaxID=1509483 RepID=UPI001595E28F|nr:gluconokinase [Flectobacillus sp. BAB-3569]